MRTVKISASSVVFSVIGLSFCLLSAFKMTDALCITQGCSVYKGLSVAGLSLYWFGGAAFGILLICAMVWNGRYLAGVAALFLILDMVFLVIQILLWSCMQCLIVAALFGAVMRSAMVRNRKRWMRWILTVWFLLFVVDGVSAVRESVVPWPLYGVDTAPVHLYFSPTCPACRAMITELLTRTDILAHIALYPIAKNGEDIQRVIRLETELTRGMPLKEALDRCEQTPVGNVTCDMVYWRTLWNIFKNVSALSRTGVTHIPFLTARSPFWSDTLQYKGDCPMFSIDASGLCADTPNGGLKDIFKSK
jgi:hypothetical protein